MKRALVVLLGSLLLLVGLAGCGYSNPGSGSSTSASSRPAY
jgi:hypothetical protein